MWEPSIIYYESSQGTSQAGEQYNVLIWTAPIRNAAGEITQVMEMSTNITQIRQLQDHLSSLGFLISSISHGIKGLLTGLDGGLYILDKGYEKNNVNIFSLVDRSIPMPLSLTSNMM